MAGTGILSKAGCALNSAWGDAWAAVTDLLPFSAESVEKTINRIDDVSLTGVAGMKKADQGLVAVAGELNGNLRS